MDTLVFTIDSEAESAKKLGYPTYVYSGDRYADDLKNSVGIRWGFSSLFYSNSEECKSVELSKVINPAAAICLNCNKEKALRKMAEVVDTPQIFDKKVPSNKLAVYRPISHTGGSDFLVKRGPFPIEYGMYATAYIQTDLEIRAWFVGDQVMCAKRIPNKSYVKTKYPCRSMFAYRFIETPRGLKEKVIKASQAISLDVGAADILVKNGRFLFMELNSACTIDSNKIKVFYRNGLDKLIKEKFGQ